MLFLAFVRSFSSSAYHNNMSPHIAYALPHLKLLNHYHEKNTSTSADVLAKEEEIARSQIQNKPPEIMDKIIQGKLKAFYEQSCLLNQKFVKEPSMNVADYVAQEGKKAGKTLEVVEFVRWQIGE